MNRIEVNARREALAMSDSNDDEIAGLNLIIDELLEIVDPWTPTSP